MAIDTITAMDLNIATSVESDNTQRFRGANWYEEIKKLNILCGGCGGIMSNTIFQLARINPQNIVVYDPDVVESVNLAGQMFNTQSLGGFKVTGIKNIVEDFSEYTKISSIPATVPYDIEIAKSIMICGFDNMKARKNFYKVWKEYIYKYKKNDLEDTLYIDGRLSFDTAQVIVFKGDDEYAKKQYEEKYLFNDWDAEETVCSMKQTSFMTNIIASLIVNAVVNYCEHKVNGLTLTPWFLEYNSNTMTLKTLE